MDYTAIIIAFISLVGVLVQSFHNTKNVKRKDIKEGMERTERKLDTISNGVEYTLQDRLLYLCEKYLERGSITAIQLKMLTNMYHAYHDLGGNDFITDLFERVKSLPIREHD